MPPLDKKIAEGAFYAEKCTDEHTDLHTRAMVDGEFAIFAVDGTKDQIFIPENMDPHNAFIAYSLEKGNVTVIAELEHAPRQWNEKGGEKHNNTNSILGRLGLKRSKK